MNRQQLTLRFDREAARISMPSSRRQELSDAFTEQWQRVRGWLIPLMKNGQPKIMTKEEMRGIAMRELRVSKNAFDFGWIAAIEDIGRQDWYEPRRKRARVNNS